LTIMLDDNMKMYTNRGKRIRPSDKNLVCNYALWRLVPLFVLVMLLLNIRALLAVDWAVWSPAGMMENQTFGGNLYLLFSLAEATGACLAVAALYYTYRIDGVKQLFHRQKLARMMLESGLFCELVEKELQDSYVEYVLLYDTIGSRIAIDDVTVNDGSMKLMGTVAWEFDQLPHMLIAGGTGGGKTYFILTIINALVKTNAKLYICDPKNADLADLAAVMPDVYYRQEDITACLDRFYDEMMARNEAMKQMSGYKTGENYAYLGLAPHFLIFDEYVAFMEMMGRQSVEVMAKLKQIVMLGRQSGFFLVLACQRPDAKYLGDGIRDQFNFRVALGRMSELGYSMMFGQTTKEFYQKRIRGRGYVDVGTNVISEFYTPLVPRGYNFVQEISLAMAENPGSDDQQPITADGNI